MNELSLADFIPLWRTLREDGVTALLTPSFDYVGALEVFPLDVRFASGEGLASLGEQLRSVISACDDGWTLHFLYRVTTDADADIDDYQASARRDDGVPVPPALQTYVAARVAWLRKQTLRNTRLYLFFSTAPELTALGRPQLGMRMQFADVAGFSRAAHQRHLETLKSARTSLQSRLAQAGLGSRELSTAAVHAVFHALLNPTHVAKGWAAPQVSVRDNLWDESVLKAHGPHLREYTESEQLCAEDVVEERGHFRQEATLRRALTLKMLPEGGTGYLAAEPLVELVESRGDDAVPFPYWLSVTVAIQRQGVVRWKLNAQHNLVDGLRNALPFLKTRSVSKDVADSSKQAGIEGLFVELNAMSSKVVNLSVSLLLDGTNLDQLEARTEVARAAFSRAGNSELLPEEVSQLPAFLSMLPGSGPYQFRKKTCTSRNAADFLPVFAPWGGSASASSLLWTPTRDVFRFDFHDPRLPAHHGLVWADTGSGKSVSLGALTLDALAAGNDAILIDHGRSWQRLTEVLGGIHVNVDIRTPITPFLPLAQMVDGAGELDAESVQDVVSFLELCVRDADLPGFNKLTVQLVARAVKHAYARLRTAPQERPLMSAFREGLEQVHQAATHPDDKAICENIRRRLGLFVGDELYGTFLDRPSSLRFDAQLVTFEMEAVAKSPITKSIAFATVMQAISTRAAARRRRTLVEVDEGHTWLGQDEAAERFLERCYRVMRKYGVAMWMVSQGLEDFQGVKAGRAILANSALKLLLFHASGHAQVAQFFQLTRRAEAAFGNLRRRAGHYSDLLMLNGTRVAAVRLALHPLALWTLTTSRADKDFLEAAKRRNPRLTDWQLLQQLAKHYPHGAPEGAVT